MELHTAPNTVLRKPKCFWTTLIFSYFLTLVFVGGLEAVFMKDWRSLFWAFVLLGVLRLHTAFWRRLLPGRLEVLGILLGFILFLTPLAFLHFAVWAYWINPIKISKETTFLTEPRTPDGKRVDFFAALQQRMTPQTPPQENGFRMMVQELGPVFALDCAFPLSKYYEPQWLELCKQLQLDFPQESGDVLPFQFQDFLTFLQEHETAKNPQSENSDSLYAAVNEKYQRLLQSPWTAEEFPEAADWMEKNEKAFDLLGKGVRMPVFFEPLVQNREDDSLQNGYDRSQTWKIMKHLPLRIQYDLGRGEKEKAWFHLMTHYRLAAWKERFSYHPSQTWPPPGTGLIVGFLQHGRFSADEIRRYREELKPFLEPACQEILDNQKFGAHLLSLDFMLRTTYSSQWHGNRVPRLLSWNQSLVEVNADFDRAWKESLEKAASPRIVDVDSSCFDRDTNSSRTRLVGFLLWYGPFKFIPTAFAQRILESTDPCDTLCCCPLPLQGCDLRWLETQKAIADLIFELARYQAENGVYPEELRNLEKPIPGDPYSSGEAFHYQRLSHDRYLLYSVGLNGLDDLGILDYETRKDDIAFSYPK